MKLWLSDLQALALYAVRRFLAWRRGSTWGYCLRCAKPWGGAGSAQPHQTWFGKKLVGTQGTFGIFPLCEACWQLLGTVERRIPFYKRLHRMWMRAGAAADMTQWSAIESALRKESDAQS